MNGDEQRIFDFNEHTFDLDTAGARSAYAVQALNAHLPILEQGGDTDVIVHLGLLYDLYSSMLNARSELLRSAVYFEVQIIELPSIELIRHFMQNLACSKDLVRAAVIGGDTTGARGVVDPVIQAMTENAGVLGEIFFGAARKILRAREDCVRLMVEQRVGGMMG